LANKWTDTELAALDAVSADTGMAAYHAFGALTGYSKSYNAFEVKRRRVTQGSPATVSALAYASGVPTPTDFVSVNDVLTHIGFRIGWWDLETTFSTQPIVLYGAIADNFGRIESFAKGKDITDDKAICKAIRDALCKYDIWVTWNGKLFDVPVLNGRLLFHGLEPLPPKMHIDLMYKATGASVRIGRRSLQSVSEYYDVPNRKTPLSVRIWDRAMAGDEAAYSLIAEHCDADVLVTRDVFNVLKPQIGTIQR
jgi:DNA polymerase elongation subunit (family B)